MEAFEPFGSGRYWALFALLTLARGLDLGSTWIATPKLVLEANPIARRLGWRWGLAVNGAMCVLFAAWPLPAIIIATTSLLVAARNLQSAWLARSMGEEAYRAWIAERLAGGGLGLHFACTIGQSALVGSVGGALVWLAADNGIVFGIGLGIVGYALAVAVYTSLAAWRLRK